MKDGTRNLLAKADRAVLAAQALLETVGPEFAAGRAYYAMFYVAEALLHEQGLQFSKHSAVHAAFGREFAKTGRLDYKFHRWLINAFDARLQDDYGSEVVLTEERVLEILGQAREFLESARQFVGTTAEP
ncbi:MAG: HEPN domain-containing protein [Acidobacteriota bacterium]